MSISEQSIAEGKALKEGEEERRDGNVAKMAELISPDTTKVLAYQKCRRKENLPSLSSHGEQCRDRLQSPMHQRRDGKASAMAVSISHDTTKVLAH
jgi:hypothetical protein